MYEEDSESNEVYTLFNETLSNTALWISSQHDKLYYVNSGAPTLQVLDVAELMGYVLQKSNLFADLLGQVITQNSSRGSVSHLRPQ